ncbi:hypothetical protein ACH5RR_017711 [Cinchona calisaya]|uniref:Uncharacterized protein n=1 Tax=Cinchona calisaya TaxID=153742 RepID=A0ABD2ZM99_9GENT
MASEDFEYDIQLWRDNQIIKNMNYLPSDIFFIQIRYQKIFLRNNPCSQERTEKPFLEEPMSPLVTKSFWVSKDSMLVHYGAGFDVLYDELVSFEVPDDYVLAIIEDVYCFAKSMIADPCNSGREILPIIIGVAALKKESVDETSIVHPENLKLDMPSTKRRRIIV